MDLRVKVAIWEKNELKNKAPPVRRTADLALFSLPRSLFQQEDKKDKSERAFVLLQQGFFMLRERDGTGEGGLCVCVRLGADDWGV